MSRPGVLVSVVIPTRNRVRYLRTAVDSARAQRLPRGSVEVLVVDDGSTDETEAVVRALPEVTYLRQENRREGAARNLGARHASGAYLAFLDDDDYYLEGKLAADVARFERGDRPALVYSRALNVDPDDRPIGVRRLPAPQGDVFWALAREPFIPMSSVSVRAEAFATCGGFGEDPALSGTADWDLWMRLAARYPFGFVDHAATAMRVHPRNMSADPAWMERGNLTALARVLADAAVRERVGRRAGEVRSHMYVTTAVKAYAADERARAARWLLRAAAAWPPQTLTPAFAAAVARVVLGRPTARALAGLVRRVAR